MVVRRGTALESREGGPVGVWRLERVSLAQAAPIHHILLTAKQSWPADRQRRQRLKLMGKASGSLECQDAGLHPLRHACQKGNND
jgi:hypothetical protein